MRIVLILFGTQLLFLSCHSVGEKVKDSQPGKSKEYGRIINGLEKEYVKYYRQLVSSGTDRKVFGLPLSDSVYLKDSLIYYQSYQEFFAQDYALIEWLLTFENDTVKSGLWYPYLDPRSSRIGQCSFHFTNSRAAMVLLENFLNGKGFYCYECEGLEQHQCNQNKYQQVKEWLAQHKDLPISELRQKWKSKNAR